MDRRATPTCSIRRSSTSCATRSCTRSHGGHLALACSAVGNRVFLSVTDDGPGIPPDDLERIFDRFYRASGPRPDDSGGAGLGLAITSRLVDLHDGTMSTPRTSSRHGARFTITLPRIVAPS